MCVCVCARACVRVLACMQCRGSVSVARIVHRDLLSLYYFGEWVRPMLVHAALLRVAVDDDARLESLPRARERLSEYAFGALAPVGCLHLRGGSQVWSGVLCPRVCVT